MLTANQATGVRTIAYIWQGMAVQLSLLPREESVTQSWVDFKCNQINSHPSCNRGGGTQKGVNRPFQAPITCRNQLSSTSQNSSAPPLPAQLPGDCVLRINSPSSTHTCLCLPQTKRAYVLRKGSETDSLQHCCVTSAVTRLQWPQGRA